MNILLVITKIASAAFLSFLAYQGYKEYHQKDGQDFGRAAFSGACAIGAIFLLGGIIF